MGDGDGAGGDTGSGEAERSTSLPYGSDDLELSVERGVST